MSQTPEDIAAEEAPLDAEPPKRRRWPKVLGIAGGVVLVAVGGLWLTSDVIVDNIIGSQMKDRGIAGSYKIESSGLSRQVLTNLVIGDPAHPDLTIERAEVTILPRFGFPAIGEVKLVRPRLYGSYKGGKLSFGSLDKFLFTGSKEPIRLPDIDLNIEDGRARIVSDYGEIGAKLGGKGNLQGGFAGELAAVAPALALPGCNAKDASLYGTITIAAKRPRLQGPVRLASLDCPGTKAKLAQAGIQADVTLDETLDGGDANLSLKSGAAAYGANRARELGGTLDLTYRKAALTSRYDLAAHGLNTPQLSAGSLGAKGMLRAGMSPSHAESEGTVSGADLIPGPDLGKALAAAQGSAKGSLAEPLLAQMRSALARQSKGSQLAADFVMRRKDSATTLVIPKGRVTGGSGDTLLSLTKGQILAGNGAPLRLAGNFTTGGAGLPRIEGRMEQAANGTTLIRGSMAEYRAGTARLALPELALAQARNGTVGFTGRALASGALLGGSVESLNVPLDGRWEPGRAFELWRGCRQVRFASLTYAKVRLDGRAISLCPVGGTAIVRSGARGMTLSARAPGLDLTGQLGDTAMHITSGPLMVSGAKLSATALTLTLGSGKVPTRLVFAAIDTLPGAGKGMSGTFSGASGAIESVPLDLTQGAGRWHFEDGRLAVSGMGFTLLDSAQVDRFAPLMSQDATLELADNRITAKATLREPKSQRAVTDVAIVHDLNTAKGSAVLDVPGLVFDNVLQPSMVTPLAVGVVANVRGRVIGGGRIDWNGDKVTSSGKFSTEGIDFAAAFGPTKGVSGTIEFTDLLGLVTAPDQQLRIASINPGIEAEDGRMSFALLPDGVLAVNGAEWPFLDGKMRLMPTTMKFGAAEVRRYTLKMEGISATRFVEKMELGNLSAIGTFDGQLPLLFDANGGRIEGGSLISQKPGGNVSYVGELTYKDLSAMGNFAFQALRSLDYKHMQIWLDGDLGGEIVAKVQFNGVSQGKGTKSNFITRQLARLPIQMNINVRAPFFALISSFKSFYDPSYLSPYVEQTLRAEQEKAHKKAPAKPVPAIPAPAQPAIQPAESEKKP